MSTLVSDPLPVARMAPFGARLVLFLGCVAAYGIGVAGLVALILGGFGLVPFTGGPIQITSPLWAKTFNLGLVALFGLQHTVMARPAFKRLWARKLPAWTCRATFTCFAGALSILMIWLWQPMASTVWQVSLLPGRIALFSLAGLGWGYLFLSTFAVDHFHLFGLRQAWDGLHGRAEHQPVFVERFFYRFDRHPIMTGALMGLWFTPDMALDRFLLAVAFTVYVLLGVAIEERDLVREHGQEYVAYRDRVRSVVPRLKLFPESRRTAG